MALRPNLCLPHLLCETRLTFSTPTLACFDSFAFGETRSHVVSSFQEFSQCQSQTAFPQASVPSLRRAKASICCECARQPASASEEDARRAINGSLRVRVEAFIQFGAPPLTLVPPYPDLPMEEVYPREEHTEIPMFFGRDIGPSRVGYFPFDIDAIFWEVLDFDHARLLKNAVLWATNEAQPASVEGAGIVDMAVWEQANSLTVALVNLTNPMMMKGPMREIMPLSNQQVRLRLPHEKSAARVHLLAADATPQYKIEGEWLSVLVPSIEDLEIVAVDFT